MERGWGHLGIRMFIMYWVTVHFTYTHGQNFPFGFLGAGNLDSRLHTRSRFSFRATTVVRPSQHLTVPSGVPFVFDEDENRKNKYSQCTNDDDFNDISFALKD